MNQYGDWDNRADTKKLKKFDVVLTANLFGDILTDEASQIAGSMGMYSLDPASVDMCLDGTFWQLLAYAAGTGGSILIVGSAAGVAAMGLENIEFVWYLKHISWLALIGYFAGALCFWLMHTAFA